MATLLMRLDAPMQAWGTQSHFSNRDTGREPSKSGIIGLLCAALGRPQHEPMDDLFRNLVELKMGVRIDQEGVIRKDYHTAGIDGIYGVDGKRQGVMLSDRYYLSDAKFLVGLEGDKPFLEYLQNALQNPVWFLFLGRKSFIPATRIWLKDGIQDADIIGCFEKYPWLVQSGVSAPDKLRVVVDDPHGSVVVNDVPLSFAPRKFLPRRVSTHFIEFQGAK